MTTTDFQPWRRLAAAALLRAVEDVQLRRLPPGCSGKRLRRNALRWLHSEDAAWIAEALNIDAEALRRLNT
jgi:hypothetical protein